MPALPSGSHILGTCRAPQKAVWRGKAQGTNKGDGLQQGPVAQGPACHGRPWSPRALGRCQWDTLSLCHSPQDSHSQTPVLRGLGSGWMSPHVSMNFLQMLKERYPPHRNKEIHHFTKHLHTQVHELRALALKDLQALMTEDTQGKEHLLAPPFPSRNITPHQYKEYKMHNIIITGIR